MANVASDLAVNGPNYSTGSQASWFDVKCAHCGGPQMYKVAATTSSTVPTAMWLRCPLCLKGMVLNDGQVSPGVMPHHEPMGMPPDESAIWNEARACLSVGANSAAVLLCRKLLLHIAVSEGLPAKNEKDRAPTFAACVDHLIDEGVVSARMRKWVEKVKDIGNDATHELTPITAQQAAEISTFTLQLLVLAYEMDARLAQEIGSHDAPASSSADH